MLYIHIGFHKTGTTTIQKFMKLNRDVLEKHGIIYPDIGLKGAHFPLAKQFRERKGKAKPAGNMWRDLRFEIDSRTNMNFVVSAETFHILPPSNIRSIEEQIRGIPVTIIAYIRELHQMIPSRYAQRVKTGGVSKDFDKFFRSATHSGEGDDLKYFKHISRWASVFGWDAVRVRTLDKQVLTGGELLRDFTAAIGLDFKSIEPDLVENSIAPRNTAPGWKALELLRELHAASGAMAANRAEKKKGNGSHLRVIASSLRHLGLETAESMGLNADRGLYLTKEQWDRCNNTFDAELRQLNEHLTDISIPTPSRAEFTGRSFLPEALRVPAEERAAFYATILFSFAANSVELVRRASKMSQPNAKGNIEVATTSENGTDLPQAAPRKSPEQRAARQAKLAARKAAKAT